MLLHDSEKLYLMFCLCCVQVTVIDDGLLKFSKLEELVLSANKISDIPAENLPSTLKVSFLCKGLSMKGDSQLNHKKQRAFPAFHHIKCKTPAVTSHV